MRVSGQVKDSLGQPLPDITVSVNQGRVKSVKTDLDGKYCLVNVPAASITLCAANPRQAPYMGEYTLSEDDPEIVINIQLPESRLLTGRVVDQEGKAVAGATVVMIEYNGVRHLDTGRYTCDPNGQFVIPHAPVDGDLALEAYGQGITTQDLKVDWDEDPYTITLKRVGRIFGEVLDSQTGQPISDYGLTDVVLSAGGSLFGVVADVNGVGLANVIVKADLEADPNAGPLEMTYRIFDQTVRTDQNGYFQMNDLWPGPYTVTASLKSNSPREGQLIHLASGESREVSFSRQGEFTLSGVIRVDLHSLSNARVKVDWGEAEYLASYTDQDGRFVLAGLEPGEYRLGMEWYPEDSETPVLWSDH